MAINTQTGQNIHGITNPALELRDKAILEIDPLPDDILSRIDVSNRWRGMGYW